MQRIQIDPNHPDPRLIRKAVDVLRSGGVIAYPTDTVYGIGCDFTQKKAVDRVYELKRMKKDQPLAFICPDLGDLAKYAVVDDATYRLMRRLTPGPYCFILRATREAPRILHIHKKRKQVGIRVPHHEVALELVRQLGNPIVSTSASWEGEPLNDPNDIAGHYGRLDMLLDAGWGGLESSTVLDLTEGVIDVVREGAGPVDII
ncbi:MAG TPA: L-threonylcarbamoyladenylate synthase [Sandaracinaceae bacterium LLY-WYZ-13_1]|nr:L-threonylcarbamoyladenylate synthase [Sandaracinaceae bacterium LLY-WYZ-13_1]